jgi:hypothetical protein
MGCFLAQSGRNSRLIDPEEGKEESGVEVMVGGYIYNEGSVLPRPVGKDIMSAA